MNINDYACEPVPKGKGISGWHIGIIYIGVGLALPAFLLGSQVGASLGLVNTLLATFIAGIILAVTGSLTGSIGSKLGLSTYMLTQITFGKIGAKFISILMAITLFGWFGVTITMFAQAINSLFVEQFMLDFGITSWSILGGILMVSTAILGFKGLDKLSIIAVPLIFILLILANYFSLTIKPIEEVISSVGNNSISFGVAISMLVGGWMVGATIMPDITRYGKSTKDAILGAFLCFVPGLLLIIALSTIPALALGKTDIIDIMTSFGWPIISTIILLMAAWSSNDNNLYSASLSIASIFPKVKKWKITLIAGLIGTSLSILGIMGQFITFLILLGVFIPPVAGVYISDYFVRKKEYKHKKIKNLANFHYSSLVSWGAGSMVSLCTLPLSIGGFELFNITTISALDGLLCGAFLQFVSLKLFKVK